MWCVIGLETSIAWPSSEKRLSFKDREIILRPATNSLAPDIAIQYHAPDTYEDALATGKEFLSSLAWVEGHAIRETMLTGGAGPVRVGMGPVAQTITHNFRADYLPEVGDSKAKLAMALYREALNVNSVAFRFLGFFKIINVLHGTSQAHKNWINSSLTRISDPAAIKRLGELSSENDIGNYLYTSGRCAVAHAFNTPLVNPDDAADTTRLAKDLPIARALAEYAIENELGVRSLRTVSREHLYELEGFRLLLGPSLLERIKRKDSIAIGDVPPIPALSVRLRDHRKFESLEALRASVVSTTHGSLILQCQSLDGRLQFPLGINLADERLEHDLIKGATVIDDGSPDAMMHSAQIYRFVATLLMNAQLEVWNTAENVLLGRCDPFVPVNIDPVETTRLLETQAADFEAAAAMRAQNSAT